MANNLNTSGLTLNSTTFNSMDIADDNIQSILDVSRWSSLPKWSEVTTVETGDIVIPDCVVDVTSFGGKYRASTITSFKTGILLGCNKVTDMYSMFYDCKKLASLDVSTFDTSKVTTTYSMFSYCSSLTSLDVSNFDTSNVTTMSYMFSECSSLASLNLSNFDTSNVTNMYRMFEDCISLTNLTLSSNWGAGLARQSDSRLRTFDLSTFPITKECANDVLSKLANVSGGTYKPIVKFKSSLGLSSTEIAVGTNKGWSVQTV